MFKYFTANNIYRYINVTQEMVDLYNKTKHGSIKMTPIEASNPENESQVYLNLSNDLIHDTQEWPKP
jgi:hypothetical protein